MELITVVFMIGLGIVGISSIGIFCCGVWLMKVNLELGVLAAGGGGLLLFIAIQIMQLLF